MSVFSGKNIKEIRKKRGLTRRELAEMSKLSVRTLESWENGREPTSIEKLIDIANALGCSVREFCDNIEINIK